MNLAELRGRYRAKLDEARALLAAGLTDETRAKYDALIAEATAVSADIARAQALETADAEERSRQDAEERAARSGRPPLPQPGAVATEGATRSAEERDAQHRSALLRYMRDNDASELRATQQSTVGANGGYSIPTTLIAEVEKALLTYGGVASYLRQLTTTSGEPINMPVSDNTSQAAAVLAENTAQSETQLTMALKQSTVSTLATGIVKIPFQLMQDGIFNWEQFAREELGESYSRGLANYLTGASTDASFDNLVSSVSAGPTSTSGTAVSLADITNLFGSVDPAYASNGSFVMNRNTQLYLASLRNTYGTPIFPLDSTGQLSTLYGRPIVIDTLLPNIAVNNRAILFGNLQKFVLRRVPGFEIVRLNERYAELGQVAFLGFFRAGSRYLDAGKHPIKALVQAAS